MEALLNNNVVLITCDSTHHPTGLMMPLSGNTIQSERFKAQIEASEPLKKQLWAQTVLQKIKNQSRVLDARGIDCAYLIPLYKNVKSGDSDNSEATAAAYYWSRVFPEITGFRRHREGDPPNHYLNYGYAILRATMARSIVASGLMPTLGIHHKNRYNAYCLADDLMEPYRPFVDLAVCGIIKDYGVKADIDIDIKSVLLKIPTIDVIIDGEQSPLMNATQRTAVSIVKCYNGEQKKLLYPEMT
jgi:CRISPR-associated protein Cas1